MGRKITTIGLCIIAATLLFAALKLPLWQMRMEAPQYKDEEALRVKVYADSMRGDLQEIKVLNTYIGVHIPENLPQTTWLPYVLIVGALAGFVAAFFPLRPRKRLLVFIPTLVVFALIFAAAQAQYQMYKIGNNRDHKTKLVGVKDFTTPLIGRVKIAQFTITSFVSWGTLAITGALALQFLSAWINRDNASLNTNNEKPPTGPVAGLAAHTP